MEESERIPADIREAAERAALVKFWKADPQWDAVVEVCTLALLAERERCAKIAENFDAWPQEGADIAAAIRG